MALSNLGRVGIPPAMNDVHMIIGVGCHQKVEAAFRFLHGVVRADVGHVAWPTMAAAPDPEWSDPLELWRVQVVHLRVDLDQLSLATMVTLMEVLVGDHNQSKGRALCHRKVWAIEDSDIRDRLAEALLSLGHAEWQSWVFGAVGFQRCPDELQDAYVRWGESEYSRTVILPCLRRLIARAPAQFDLDT